MGFRTIKKQSLSKTMENQADTEKHLEKLLPGEILQLLRIKKYSELAVGAQQYFNASIMDINTEGFSEYAGKRSAEQVFAYINRMLERLIPIVGEHQGIVESFCEGGMTSLFPDDRGNSLRAAVIACDCIQEMKKEDPLYGEVGVGICFGPVMAGVVGHEKRINVLTLSESKNFASFLRSLGSRYGAKIIVSSSYMERLGELEKTFHYRQLGCVHLGFAQRVEKIYDVYDGDCVEIRNLKRKTKIVFEKGVDLFQENQPDQARLHFIEVLKMDHGDRAAKEYLLRCDRELNGETGSGRFLEVCL